MPRATVKIQCIVCLKVFRRKWPNPYGTAYLYAGVCDACKTR